MFRFMRMIILFDLPMETSSERRAYTKFRKYLIKNGFMMLQKSVYSKLVINSSAVKAVKNGVRKNKPSKGLVQMLTITEKQFSSIENIVGDIETDVVQTSERTIYL